LRIAIVGLGGLGSWIAEALVRSGFSNIILFDNDKVEAGNLNRQNYTIEDLEKPKRESLVNRLRKINPNIYIELRDRLTENNIKKYFSEVDLLIDATDNLRTRYLINEYSVLLEKSWIFSAVSDKSGYVCLIDPRKFCLNCFYSKKKENLERVSSIETVWLAASIVTSLVKKFSKKKEDNYLYYFRSDKMLIERFKVKRKRNCEVCSRI